MKNYYISSLHFISKHLFLLLILSSATLGMNSNAAITQVGGFTTAYANGAQYLRINKPTGAQVGDVLILNILKYRNGNISTPYVNDKAPGDWTIISSKGLSGNNSVIGAIMYKIITVDWEPTTYDFVLSNWQNTDFAQATIVAYRGVDTSNPLDVTPGTITTPASTSTTVSPPGITTVTDNALVAMFGMSCATGDTTPRTFSTWTLATSPTLTELYDSHGGNYYAAVGAATGLKSKAGSTGVGTITVNNNAYLGGIILALRPIVCSGRWTGDYSTDWNDTRNWCDGIVPTKTTDVLIPKNATRQPTIGSLGGECNNITINVGATLTQKNDSASNLFVYGNWKNDGTYTPGIGTAAFAGASAQTIDGNGTMSFYNLTIQNTGGVTLNKAITVTRALLLISGIVNTTTTNLLSVTSATVNGINNVYGVIMGGSSISYINGPVKWSLPANLVTGSVYKFPVGKGTYLPYTLVNPITGGTAPTVQVEAFNANSNGSISGTLTALSTTEYWRLTTTGNFTNSQITLGKGNNPVYPYNVVAASGTQNGQYTPLGGTPDFYEVSKSSVIGNNRFFTLGTTNTPTINISPIVLGGFGYVFNFGPSTEQTFTVNGTSLPADIEIIAPDEYEISRTPGIGFGKTITLTRTGNNVPDYKIYIRLRAGLAVGLYNAKNIDVRPSGSTTLFKTIECNGTVFATTPSIITSGGRNCTNDSITLYSSSADINILYWTGPNNYYSQQMNPVRTPIDASMSGTYTVTGSLPTGANLIVNGTFELGNVGFLSSYINSPTANNYNQGIYAIIDDPYWLNNGAFGGLDSPDAGTKQMVVDGANTANATVWSETVNVVKNSTYQFTYWLRNIKISQVDNNPSIIQLYANNVPVGTPFTAPASVADGYKKYYYNWSSGDNTSVTLDLRNQNTASEGNDFALDDIDFRTVTQVSSSVKVTDNDAAAVSIYTPTNNVATGTNVTFTATPTNGGTGPLYQWSVNGTNIGTNSSSSVFNYVPSNGDVIKCVMTSDRSCTNPKEAISNLIIMAVAGTKNYWMGAVGAGGTVWSNPANWTANKVPASGDDVEFASTVVGSYGTAAINDLYLDYNRVVGNLINNASGRNLIIHADKELVVNNKILLTPVADVTKKYDQIQIKADNTGVLPNGSLIFYNPESEAVNATIEFFSKAYKEPTPIVVPTGSYSYNWQLFGIPLTSVTADPTFYDSYVRQYQENKPGLYNKWVQLNNASVLEPFKGYEITQLAPKTITFQGTLVNKDMTISLPVTAKEISTPIPLTSVYFRGQHIVSNPYAAAIDAREIVYGANTESTAYLYNTGSFAHWYNNNGSTTYDENSATAGQYIALPKATAGSNNVPFDIPSMSGFLVKATDTLVVAPATPSPGSIQIKYSSVIVKNVHPLRVKKSESVTSTDLISTKIDLIGLHYSDRMWIFTEPSCSKNFDNGWDGRKILGSSLAPQIYAVEPDGDYQVNSVADMHNTDIAFQPGDEVEYTLKFTNENIRQKYAGIYLQDLVENKTIDVTESGTTYKFATAPASEPSKRFKIITRYYEKDAPDTESSIKIFSARATVFIQNLSTNSGECTLYDVLGRTIAKKIYGPNSVTEIGNLTQGAYVTTAITNGEKVSKRIIVQ